MIDRCKGSICLLPHLQGLGGPASFHARFSSSLQERGIDVHHDPLREDCAAVLVIGGTKRLDLLWQARRRGVRIVQRLDGMNWIHKRRPTGWKHYLRSEINNCILAVIRRYFADAVIYQSQYVETMWQKVFGQVKAVSYLIYNGVNLNVFTPLGIQQRPESHVRLLVVEGRLKGGHELGLENAIRLVRALGHYSERKVELMVLADIAPNVQKEWEQKAGIWITWGGVVAREKIPEIDRSAHLFFSAEVNAPCPNSVIEALACGLPVISYETGSLPELVKGDAGRLVPYGSQYACLGEPDSDSLAQAAMEILENEQRFRWGARKRAESAFDIENIASEYLDVLLNS